MLRIRGLTCGYRDKRVLQDIDLEVCKGESFGIIGPNGSGKTTLLKSITGMTRIFSGEISFQDRNIRLMDRKELARHISMVAQMTPSVDMTVEEFILLGRLPHRKGFKLFESKEDILRAERSMELTGTEGLKERYISEISGGELQLVLIAKALTQTKDLLLLDEPTAHLDISHQVGILDLLTRLKRDEGLTIMIVIHDLNLASEYCDRLLLLDRGRIRRLGPPQEVINYRDIEDTYRTTVVVDKNPLSNKPFVLVVSEEVKKRWKG
ncbi:MAG: ABC transporter ATP-binding protein [Syntrophorhabdaceae bacterium]|nr:ABC transporter ATP-binding protein [Syntrophorhabdaceae bacterium]